MKNRINKEINDILYIIKPKKEYKGYFQSIRVLEICCTGEYVFDSLDKNVYPLVASRFNCNPKSIEKNIRLFLDNIDYAKLSGILNVEIDEPLEVKEFVYMIVAYVYNKYSAGVYR